MAKEIIVKGYKEDIILDARILRTDTFGTMISEEEAFCQLDLFKKLGGRTLDTAAIYGDWQGKGCPISELTIGKWLKKQKDANEVRIITKGGHYKLSNPEVSRVTPDCIRADILQSLDALGVESIDIYLLHRDNPAIPIGDIMECLNRFVIEGKIKAIGAANWTTSRIKEANAYASEHGLIPFTCSEVPWGLAVPTDTTDSSDVASMSREEYMNYREMNIAVFAEDPIQGGILSDWMADPSYELPERYRNRSTRMAFETAKRYCKEENILPSQLQIAFILSNELQAGAVFSCGKLEEMDQLMKAGEIKIPKKVVEDLNLPRVTIKNLYEDDINMASTMRTLVLPTGSEPMTISRIICGMSHLGSDIDMETSYAILDAYYEAGGRTFDTAHVYGMWKTGKEPLSELCLGKWIKSRKVRDEVQVITKGCHPDLEHMDVSRVGARFIEMDLEESLKALQTDYIDIYMLHRDDTNVKVQEIIDVLNVQWKKGKIRSFAASNWSVSRIKEANEYARDNNLEGFACSEVIRTLAVMNPGSMSQDIPVMTALDLEYYKDDKIPILAWGSLAGGIMIKGAEGNIDAVSPAYHRQFYNKATLCRITNLKKMVKESGLSAAQLSIAYLSSHPIATAALVGASSVDQMNNNMKSATLQISETMIRELEYVPDTVYQEMLEENEKDSKLSLEEIIDYDTTIGKMYAEGFEDIFESQFGSPENAQTKMLMRMTFRQLFKIPGINAQIKESDINAFLERMNKRREDLLAKKED